MNFILFLLVLLFSIHHSNGNFFPSIEYHALCDLYHSTNGDKWTWLKPYVTFGYPWNVTNSNSNPCSIKNPWQGIKCSGNCSSSPCHVIEIALPRRNATGYLPPTLQNFTQLINFSMPNNYLFSSLPNELGNIQTLGRISLGVNNLTGTIPETFGNLLSLEFLALDDNSMIGSIPQSLSNLLNLNYLSLFRNAFTGTLSPDFSNWTKLTYINLQNNHLFGSLPSSFGNLSSVEYFDIAFNDFSQTLPSSLQFMESLQAFIVDFNKFSGTIPKEYANIKSLRYFVLSSNNLVGSFPSSFFNSSNTSIYSIEVARNKLQGTISNFLIQIPSLRFLDFGFNYFSGTIPFSIDNLNNLEYLSISGNPLSGTIPPSIGNLTLLKNLLLTHCHLTGSLPPSFSNLTHLKYLSLSYNSLNGTLPVEYNQMISLETMMIYNNELSGTVPFWTQLSSLQYLMLQNNRLTGPIPFTLGLLPVLSYLNLKNNLLSGSFPTTLTRISFLILNNNALSGSLPMDFGNQSSTTVLFLNNNFFTGTLPLTFGYLKVLEYLSLDFNQLTGTIPGFLGAFADLKYFSINNNNFKGNIPSQLSQMTSLSYLDFSNNTLSGTLPSSFNGSFPRLQYLSLSNNRLKGTLPDYIGGDFIRFIYITNNSFTGTLPASLFGSQKLLAFVASLNCFTGTLPETFCLNHNLSQLILDGLHSSKTCSNKIFKADRYSGYYLNSGVEGEIPSCLLNMPNLKILHLSGNILGGSIPELSFSNMTSMILSNNLLVGKVPDSVWSSGISYLDLSFNRLTDSVEYLLLNLHIYQRQINENITIDPWERFLLTNKSLFLKVNRFSGNLPETVNALSDINVLEGNMFDCSRSRDNLPTNDPKYTSYQCGSIFTNISLYIWTSFIGLFLLGLIFFNHNFQKLVSILRAINHSYEKYISILMATNLPSHDEFLSLIACGQGYLHVRRLILIIGLWVLLIMMPTYYLLSIFYGVYQNQYVWIVSEAYLQGYVPTIIIFLLLTVILMIIMYQLRKEGKLLTSSWKEIVDNHSEAIPMKQTMKAVLLLGINVFVVLLVNIGYITAINHGFDNAALTFISLCISLFKLLWANLMLLGPGRYWLETSLQVHIPPLIIILIFIFNNILAPYLAEALISPNCFYYAITRSPKITSYYYNFRCSIIDYCVNIICNTELVCPLKIEVFNPELITSVSYFPPFHYNYGCSSSLLSAFSYIFIYRFIITSLIEPLIFGTMKYLQVHHQRFDWLQKGFFGHFFSTSLFRRITSRLPLLLKFEAKFPHIENPELKEDLIVYTIEMTEIAAKSGIPVSERVIVRMVSDFALFLSFGVLFPPLAFIIALSLMKDLFVVQSSIGRFIRRMNRSDTSPRIKEKLRSLLQVLNEQFKGFDKVLWTGIWWSTLVSVLFWTFALFDTLGNKTGAIRALWIVIVMASSPYWSLGCIYIVQKVCFPHALRDLSQSLGGSLEMIPIDKQVEENEKITKMTSEGIEGQPSLSAITDPSSSLDSRPSAIPLTSSFSPPSSFSDDPSPSSQLHTQENPLHSQV